MNKTKVESKVVSGWMVEGKFYCSKECATKGIPLAFIPKGSKCMACGKEIRTQ